MAMMVSGDGTMEGGVGVVQVMWCSTGGIRLGAAAAAALPALLGGIHGWHTGASRYPAMPTGA
jgi:hypothetical protein